MIIASIAVSIITSLIEFFTKGRRIVLVSYGFIIPLLILLPRIFYRFDSKIRKVVKFEWVKKIEYFSFFIIVLNAPASLVLHELGIEYDRFLHFSVAFFAFIIFLLLWLPVIKIRRKEIKKKSFLPYIFILLLIGLFLWEALQYDIDQFFGTKLFFDLEQEIKIDFLEDILFGILGLFVALFYINLSFKKFLSTLE